MRKLFSLLLWCLLIPLPSSAQVAYTWVDANGVLHFSDSPNSTDSAEIELPNLETDRDIAPPPEPEPKADSDLDVADSESQPPPPAPEPLSALAMDFVTPANDQVIHNNAGNFSISVQLNRNLSAGEQLQLWVDDKPYRAPQVENEWHLKNIDRGSHKLQVHATQSGKQIASTMSITVHLKRPSVLN